MNNLTKAKKRAILSEIARIDEELQTTFSYGPYEIGLAHDRENLQKQLEVIDHEEQKRLVS